MKSSSHPVWRGLLLPICLIFSFDLVSCVGAVRDAPLGFLCAKGGVIVDERGSPILLRGIGLGGLFVPEGYMLKTPVDSPSAIRASIAAFAGAEATDEFFRRYEEAQLGKGDIALIASWGFNSVRIPISWKMFGTDSDPEATEEAGFAKLDAIIEDCARTGIYAVIDLHCAPGSQNSQGISDSDGTARLWTEKERYWPRTIDLWKRIAARYADNAAVGGYDLLNEPVLPDGVAGSELKALYAELSRAIREVDSKHLLFIEGDSYATDFSSLVPPWDANMVYSFHKYWNGNALKDIAGYLALRDAYGVPLWMGESGENSNQWIAESLTLLESNGIGWSFWTLKKFETTASPFSARIPASARAAFPFWNGGRIPSPEEGWLALTDFADALRTENCQAFPDLLDAIRDPRAALVNRPFKEHGIPGRIDAVDYDLGGEGRAYHDSFHSLLDNAHWRAWNSGGEYRNDGVDIERCTDPAGPAFDVGWIEAGEWLAYTVYSPSAGRFSFKVKAAGTGGGKISVEIDGKPRLERIGIAPTGGWQDWVWMEAPEKIEFAAGKHRIRILIEESSGFNLSGFELF